MKIEEINDETEVLTITWKIADLKEAFESKELEFNELNLNHALSSLFKMPMDALVCGNRPSIILPHDEDFFMRALSYYMRISDMQAA